MLPARKFALDVNEAIVRAPVASFSAAAKIS
jgi:hypothetical protein